MFAKPELAQTPTSTRYATPSRHQGSLVGILGTSPPPLYDRSPSPKADTRPVTAFENVSPKVPQLHNKLAQTVNHEVIFQNELRTSPYIRGRRNPDYHNRSLSTSDCLTAPNYEPESSAKKPTYRLGSQQRLKHRDLTPSITRPEEHSYYLSPPKSVQKKETLLPSDDISRKLNFEDPQLLQQATPKKTDVVAGLTASKSQERATVADNFKEPNERPGKEPESARNLSVRGVSPAEPQQSTRLGRNANLSIRNQSMPKVTFGHYPKVVDVNLYQPESSIQKPQSRESSIQRPEPTTTGAEIPYYLKRQAANKALTDTPTHSKTKENQDILREYNSLPISRPKTPQKMLDLTATPEKFNSDVKKQVPETPLSCSTHGSHGSDSSGKDLICEKCVNRLLSDLKKTKGLLNRTQEIKREQEQSQISNRILESAREKEAARREAANQTALINREMIEQKERLRSSSKKIAEKEHYLDKIFQNEDALKTQRRNRSKENEIVLKNQIEQRRRERENKRLHERSLDFEPGMSRFGESDTTLRASKLKELNEELKRQIEQHQLSQREDKQVKL